MIAEPTEPNEKTVSTPLERGDSFAIYQLKESRKLRAYRFESLNGLRQTGRAVAKESYNLVYIGRLQEENGSTAEKLEKLFIRFHLHPPADFTGRTLSISDVVVLWHNGIVSCHYCDTCGFRELSGFLSEVSAVPLLLPGRS